MPTVHAVVLLDAGAAKIEVIKQLRELSATRGIRLGLKEAKGLADAANPHAPPVVAVDLDAATARHWGATLATAGAHVRVDPPFGAPSPPPPPGSPAANSAPTGFAVVLLAAGRKKIAVIKEVKVLTGLGLAEAKRLVDDSERIPQPVLVGLSDDEARRVAAQISSAGASVEIRPS
jgi:large subunit ribosomal protein L7/L12